MEALEDNIYVYCDNDVFQTALLLSEIETRFASFGYCRISKSMVVNLHQIDALKNIGNSRIEATMSNNEKVLISRHYAPLLREKLGL